MAITTALVTGLTPATTGTVNFTVSGFGTPQAAIITVSGASSGSNPAAHSMLAMGWVDGTATCSMSISLEDAQATSDTYRYGNQTTVSKRVITLVSVSGSPLIAGNFSAWTTGGITIDFVVASATQYTVSVQLIKGCTTIASGSTNMTGTAAHTVSSLSGKPNLVYFLCHGTATGTSVLDNALFSFGAAHNSSSNVVSQGQVAFSSADGSVAEVSNTVTRNDSCVGQLFSDAQSWKASVSNFTSTGFDLTADVSPAGDTVFWLAMDTGDTDGVHVGVVDSPTSTGTWSITSPGFQPQLVTLGINTTLTTNVFRIANPMGFGIGMFTSSAQAYVGVDCDDGAADTDTQSNFSSAAAVQLYHFGGTTHDIMHQGAYSSMDATGYSLSFPTYVDATTRRWLSVAIKAATGGNTASASMAWLISAQQTKSTAWQIHAQATRDLAYAIFNTSAKNTGWGVLNSVAHDSAWRVLGQYQRDVAWPVLTSEGADTAWRVLASSDHDTAWQILASGVSSIDVAWRVLASVQQATASRILAQAQRDSGWAVLNQLSLDSGWAVLTSHQQEALWRILAGEQADVGWRVINSMGGNTAWRVLAQQLVDAGWSIQTTADIDTAWAVDGVASVSVESMIFTARARTMIVDAQARKIIFVA